MFIIPTKETATGLGTLPVFGSILTCLFLFLYIFVARPHAENLEKNKNLRMNRVNEKIQLAARQGLITDSLAIELLNTPELLTMGRLDIDLPSDIQVAYKKYLNLKPVRFVDGSNFNIRGIIHGLFNQSIFLFFLLLVFFYLSSFYIEHIFSTLVFFTITLLLFLALFVLNFKNEFTWMLPLEQVFPIMTLSLWGLVLRMAYRSQMVIYMGILPIRKLSVSLSVSTLLMPILLAFGLLIEHLLNKTFIDPKNPLFITLMAVIILSLLPLIIRSRMRIEENSNLRVVGKALNDIASDIKAGELDRAKLKLKELNSPELNYEQNIRLGELAWSAGLPDLVRTAFNRQLLKFEGTPAEKDTLMIKMLTQGMLLPGSNYETLFKRSLQNRDSSALRSILPYLKSQRERTQEAVKIYLRESIKSAVKNKDHLFLEDISPFLKGMPIFSSLVSKIERFQKEQSEEEVYVDNYARTIEIHKLINIELTGVFIEYIEMKLSNGSVQQVPWSALRSIYGVFVQSSLCGVLLLEFKKKLFACKFNEKDVKDCSFKEIWKKLKQQAPDTTPMVAIDDFGTISEDGLLEACQQFLLKA